MRTSGATVASQPAIGAPLEATLLDLLYELQGSDVPVVLGGGYGLFLRQRQLDASGERLLLNAIVPVRATNDLDVFPRTEMLADSMHRDARGLHTPQAFSRST